jgi:flagellum-specific peptidoglycan hydrolase FlgJ
MTLFTGLVAFAALQPEPAPPSAATTPMVVATSSTVAQTFIQPSPTTSATPRPAVEAAVSLVATPVPQETPVVPEATAEPEPPRPAETITYVVQDGDTLSEIADEYGISPESIKWANNGVDDPDFLSVGQKLIIPPLSGILHTVVEGDTLLEVAELYQAESEEIVAVNALQDPFLIAVGDLLIVPGGKPPEPEEPQTLLAMAVPERVETAARSSRVAEPAPAPAPAPAPRIAGLSAANSAFLNSLVEPAQQSMRETGVPASVTIAQAIWEADWGRSGLAIKANNYFGIKGRPNPGPAGVIWLTTWEHVNGRNVTVKEPFKVYNSLWESVMDHGVFIAKQSRYAEAMKYRHDPKTFIRLVHRAGYATDPAYTDKIVNLMERYNLYVYDQI